MNNKRLGQISLALLHRKHPDGHWLVTDADPKNFLTHNELFDLVRTSVIIEAECVKYGLEDMGGNHAEVLLRHMAGSKAAIIGAKDALIEILQKKLLTVGNDV